MQMVVKHGLLVVCAVFYTLLIQFVITQLTRHRTATKK